MNETTALILRDDNKLAILFSTQAEELKQAALASSALVGRVSNAAENEIAVKAQAALHALVTSIEKARKAEKEPILIFGDRLDQSVKTFSEDLKSELLRVSTLIGDFAALEQAKARSADAARNEALNKIERERLAEASQATSHDALDAVNEHFNRRAAEAVDRHAYAPARADGQKISADWDITVTDVWTLARCHPGCVKIEPRLSEIKDLLKQGIKVSGITAVLITKAGVSTRQSKPIEV